MEKPKLQLCMKTAIREHIMALARQITSTGQGGRVVKLPTPVNIAQSRVKTENNEKSSPSSSQAGASNKLAPTRYAIQSSTERKPAPAVPPKPPNLLKNNGISKLSRNNAPSITQTEIFSSAPSLKDTSRLTTEKLKSPDTSKLVSTPNNLKSNISDSCRMSSPHVQPTQGEVPFRIERTVSNEDDRYSSRPENLADTYQSVTSKIHEVGAAATRDPVIRRDISTTFKEINIVLCGSPRVGKSSLINAICQQMLAKTTPGLDSCTHAISRYYLKGFENWTPEDIRRKLEDILKKPKSDILCMIYCASPGSYTNLQQLHCLLNECMKRQIFCALVCTNKYAGQTAQRNAVLQDFQRLLADYHVKTGEKNGISYFGHAGLCTAVNSEKFSDEDTGRTFDESGIDELIFGIMESLNDEKVAQWCMVAFENKSFWKNVFRFPAQLKAFWNRLVNRA